MAPSIRSADQHGAQVREKSHQHVDGRRCKSTAAFIIALADDQQVVAPVDRPHTVRIQVGKPRPDRPLLPIRARDRKRSVPGKNKRRRKTSRASGAEAKGHAAGPVALDADVLERRRGRERNGRPVGRYLMCVHVRPELVQIAVLQGRNLIEHYVSRPQDDGTA